MGNIGDSFGTTLPVVGSSGPTYATDYNAIMTEVMARLSSRVPLSSLSLTSSFDLNGQGILNALYVILNNTASSPGASPVNRITAFGGNLYWVSPSGVVQITAGAALNSAALGGIIGDYGGANPAKVSYDSANTRYEFFHNQSTNTWANLRARGIDISAAATGTVMAQLRYGGAGTLTFTLPPTLPAANAVLGISSGGAITSNPSIGADITLSGATTIKHGSRTIDWHCALVHTTVGTYSTGITSDVPNWTVSTPGTTYIYLPALETGTRIISVELAQVDGGTASTVTFNSNAWPGTAFNIPVTRTNPGAGRELYTFNTPYVLNTTTQSGTISCKVVAGSGTTVLRGMRITYDRV